MSELQVVYIRPLVLFGIGEYYKRKAVKLKSKNFIVMGSLYGVREGLTVEVSLSNPLKITDNQKETVIDKKVMMDFFTASDNLVRAQLPGNSLINLQVLGLYQVRKDLTVTADDLALFEWLSEKGFQNQRLMLINLQGKHQVHTYKRQDGRLVQTPFSYTIEPSESICIKGLSQKSKDSPYLKTLQANFNLMTNYNQKLIKARKLVEKIDDPDRLRELNTILNSLRLISEQKSVLQTMDSAVVFNLSVAMTQDTKGYS